MIRSDEKWIWRWKNKFKACYSVWRNEWLSLVEREREKKSWRFILLIHATRELLPWCLHILDKPCNFTVTTLLFFFFEYFHQYCSKSCSYLAILIQIDIYNFKEETKRSYRSNLSSFCRFPRNDGLPWVRYWAASPRTKGEDPWIDPPDSATTAPLVTEACLKRK